MIRVTREQWRPIPGYEGYYDVSNFGNLRTYYKNRKLSDAYRGANLHLSTTGYLIAYLHKDKKLFRTAISRLVLLAFVGPPPIGKPYACHGDRNTLNNRLRNLRWGSNADNQADRIKHGTSNRGEANGKAILSEEGVKDIKRRLAFGETQASIADDYGIDPSAVSNIKIGRNWGHVQI